MAHAIEKPFPCASAAHRPKNARLIADDLMRNRSQRHAEPPATCSSNTPLSPQANIPPMRLQSGGSSGPSPTVSSPKSVMKLTWAGARASKVEVHGGIPCHQCQLRKEIGHRRGTHPRLNVRDQRRASPKPCRPALARHTDLHTTATTRVHPQQRATTCPGQGRAYNTIL